MPWARKNEPDAYFADLPGYGYAAVARGAKLRWQQVMANYLAERRNLGGVVLLVDPRQGLTELDQQLLQFVAPRVGNGEVKLLVVLTKADKLSRNEGAKALAAAQKVLADLATDDADIGVLLFSALNRQGLEDIALVVRGWVETAVTAKFEATQAVEPPPDAD